MIQPITAQEALNKNWQHFIVEGNAPGYVRGACFYRSPDGCRCGVGVLIPDELYSSAFEAVNVGALMRHTDHPDIKEPNMKWDLVQELFAPMRNDRMGVQGADNGASRFLSVLQRRHDECAQAYGPTDFKRFYADDLRALAADYSLVIPSDTE